MTEMKLMVGMKLLSHMMQEKNTSKGYMKEINILLMTP